MFSRCFRTLLKNALFTKGLRKFGGKHEKKQVNGKIVVIPSALAALGYICYRQLDRIQEREERKQGIHRDPAPFGPWRTKMYVSLVPRRIGSRVWAWMHEFHLPVSWREPIYGFYVRKFNCNLEEAAESDLKKYVNLSEFFRRSVKRNLRPISTECLVSPADGRIDKFGEVTNNRIEQVKGLTYEMSAFLGSDLASKHELSSRTKKLFYCVIYLGPGDYHGFHSPTNWEVTFRRHFTGHLLGVNHKVTSRVPNLFCINERVLLTGNWRHGFFSMTAVGATNVGNISIDFERTLKTNNSKKKLWDVDDMVYNRIVKKQSGDKIGEFRFGSSVVLLFEAPSDFKFRVDIGQKVKYGDALGTTRVNDSKALG